ncbi:MAG: efflux RND transporter periplasmic adaptor subunit [Pseudomonadota bacterium]
MQALKPTVAICLAALLAACGGEEPPPPAAVVRPAKLIQVESSTRQRDLSFPAVVRAVQSAELTFPVPGEVIELSVLEGDEVTAGTVIARLDQRDVQSSLVQAEAEYRNALAEFRRAEDLVREDAISQSILESRQTLVDVRLATVDTARKALEDTEIEAPFDGAVSRVYIERYQNVQAKEPIAVLQSDTIEAIINVPGGIVARIPQFEPVGTRVVLDAAPETEMPAVLRETSGVADSSSQTFEVSFAFEPPDGLLILPGMTATVHTTFLFTGSNDVVASGLSVPLSAILAEGERRFVWVVDTNMALQKREVVVAPDFSSTATVTSGLNGGETIVEAGVAFLSEGMTVRAWQSR